MSTVGRAVFHRGCRQTSGTATYRREGRQQSGGPSAVKRAVGRQPLRGLSTGWVFASRLEGGQPSGLLSRVKTAVDRQKS